MQRDRTGLRERVEAAALAEMERVGPEAFRAADVVRQFVHEAGRATLFRWLGDLISSGRAGQHLARKVKEKAAARAASAPECPAAAAAQEAAAALPVVVNLDDLAAAGGGGIRVVDEIARCIALAKEVMAAARGPDGRVRMTKTALSASDHLRRSVETLHKLQQAVLEAEQIEAFHGAVLAEVAKESPECAERIVARLRHLNAQYEA